ncbi:MAG: hypothetical protein ACE5G3_11865 [Gammaproteobacteria bacterium]
MKNLAVIVLMLGLALPARAADEADTQSGAERPEAIDRRAPAGELELESTSIRGNRELPRLLYIVPWKDASLGDVTGKPVNSLIDEVLAPLDRDVFLRQTKYFDQLYGSPETGVSD